MPELLPGSNSGRLRGRAEMVKGERTGQVTREETTKESSREKKRDSGIV